MFLEDGQGKSVAALVVSVSPTQIQARVPFGSATGKVKVKTSSGEAQSGDNLSLRTSVSGFIEEVVTQSNGQVGRRPVSNITVRISTGAGQFITQNTGSDGSFVLADAPPGVQVLEINTQNAPIPYPSRTLKVAVTAGRDNQLRNPIEIKSVNSDSQNSLPVNAGQNGGAMTTVNQSQNLPTTFGLPDGCTVSQPPGAFSSRLTISLLDSGRVPGAMPPGYYSTAVGQISPFGAVMSPGGTLRLPNADNIPSGVEIKLFRFDQPTQQTPDSPTIGTFIEIGRGNIGQNNQIEATENNTQQSRVRQTTLYFVSRLYPTISVKGRVIGSDGIPVTRALVQTRGQYVFTDEDGKFMLDNVPVIRTGDSVTLEVSYMRPDRLIDRTERGPVGITANTTADLQDDIVLPGRLSPDQPLVIAPPRLTVNENQTLDFSFVASSQPVAGQMINVIAFGQSFASVFPVGGDVYTLRLAPAANTAGEYTVYISATNDAGLKYLYSLGVRVRKPPSNAPTADDQSLVTARASPVNFTLSGSDPLGRSLTLVLLSSPTAGGISGLLPNLVYTPLANFSGIDSFRFRAIASGTSSTSEPSVIYVIVR